MHGHNGMAAATAVRYMEGTRAAYIVIGLNNGWTSGAS